MHGRTTQDGVNSGRGASRRDGVGSSRGRVLAAINRTRAIKEVAAAPAGADVEAQELERLERIYSARRERERMFEQQARVLEALLSQ
jgi:hypothetical protein